MTALLDEKGLEAALAKAEKRAQLHGDNTTCSSLNIEYAGVRLILTAARAYLSALPGEAEVVALIGELLEWHVDGPQKRSYATQLLCQRAAASLQAMQARAENAERERDAFRDMADGYGKLDAELAIAEARVKELEGALEPFATAARYYARDGYADEQFVVNVSTVTRDGEEVVAALRRADYRRARTALKGDENE